ncbi:hypothetical protein Tco_0759743 [Tanacetum coccineum]
MVLSLPYSTPPKRNVPSIEESIASISKLSTIIDANIEKQRQTFDLMSTITQTHQRNPIMSSTTNFAKPETTTDHVATNTPTVTTSLVNTDTPTVIMPPSTNRQLVTTPPPNHGPEIHPLKHDKPMAKSFTVSHSSITNIEKVTAKNTTTVNVTTSTTITAEPPINYAGAIEEPFLQRQISVHDIPINIHVLIIQHTSGNKSAVRDTLNKSGTRVSS